MAPYRINISIKSDSYESWPSIHVLKKFELFAIFKYWPVTWQWSLSKRVISLKRAVDCTLHNQARGRVYWLFETQ